MECSRQPTQGKSDIFAAAGLCWPRALGTLLLQLPTAPRRQGIEHEFPQLVACNLFLLEMLGGGGRRTEKQLHPAWSHWKVSLATMTFPWLIAPIQHVLIIRYVCTWVSLLRSAMLFGEARRWAGRRVGAIVPPLALPPWCSLCAVGWFSSPSVPTPSHHLTNSSASGNLMEEVCCLAEQAQWACFALPCLFKAFWSSYSSDIQLFYIRCELFRDVCNQPDFLVIEVRENMMGRFPKSPTLLKVHEKEIFWAG